MDSQESLARSLSAIHKGCSKRQLSLRDSTYDRNRTYGSLNFLDIPSLPFGSEDGDATASHAPKPSGLPRRSTYSHSRPQDPVGEVPRQKTILRKSSLHVVEDCQRQRYFSKSLPSLGLDELAKPKEETSRAVQPRQHGEDTERAGHRGFRTD